jgi:hypothetical protein
LPGMGGDHRHGRRKTPDPFRGDQSWFGANEMRPRNGNINVVAERVARTDEKSYPGEMTRATAKATARKNAMLPQKSSAEIMLSRH